VKHVDVDQKLPDIKTHSQVDRVNYLASSVPRSSIEVVKDISILFGDPNDLTAFQNDVKSTWSRMSGYVHPSLSQTSERLQRARRGAFIGFEDAKAPHIGRRRRTCRTCFSYLVAAVKSP
jgi:hypothetical protein